MGTIKQNIVYTIITIAVAVSMAWVVTYGWTKNEKVECMKLYEQKIKYQNWFATDWQKEMCLYYGYKL